MMMMSIELKQFLASMKEARVIHHRG